MRTSPGPRLGGHRYASPINRFAVTSREGRGGPQRDEAGARCVVNIQCADAGATGVEGVAGVEGAGGTGGPGCGARGRWRGLAGLRDEAQAHVSTPGPTGVEGAGGTGGPGCGARGRWRGLAGLRGAAPNEVRPPSLAGGRALRRPEHPWGTQSSPARRTAYAAPGIPAASAAPQRAYSCSARPFLTARSRQYRKTSRKMPPKKMHAMAIQMPGGACRPYLRKYT